MTEAVHIVCPQCEAVNRLAQERLADQPVCGKCAHALFLARPLDVSSAQFAKHIGRNDIPVLVDFWAEWCGPWQDDGAGLSAGGAALEPAVRLLKVNTESAPDLSARYIIRSIPTLALFKGGREVARQAGAMDAGSIVTWAKANS